MDVVVLPRDAEVVAVRVGVGVDGDECLADLGGTDVGCVARRIHDLHAVRGGMSHDDDVVALARDVRRTLTEEAMRIALLVHIHLRRDLVTVVEAVYLRVMVAEGDCPIDPEPLHHAREHLRLALVVEGARLEGHGISHIARHDDEVGLDAVDGLDHRLDRPPVLLRGECARADVDIREMQHAEGVLRAVRDELVVARLAVLGLD